MNAVRRGGMALLVLVGLGAAGGFVPAGEKKAPLKLPAVLEKNAAPATVPELRAIETHLMQVLKRITPAVVCVRDVIGRSSGSGVIISPDGYVLTAAHVSAIPNRELAVLLPSGKVLKAKALGLNKGVDNGLVKITQPGPFPYVDMGKSADLKQGHWVVAIGHPGGFRANRTPVVRLGRVLFANPFVIQSDCTTVGGDSGGPLFDMNGNVVGIHSRIGMFHITQNFHVPVDAYKESWDRLVLGDIWGGQLGSVPTVKPAGGKMVYEKKDVLTSKDPLDRVKTESHCRTYPIKLKAGATYTLDLISGDKSGKDLDTFLRLENSEGKEVAQDDDGGGFPNARIVYKVLRGGDYRMIVTSFTGKQTGSFRLVVHEAELDVLVSGQVEVLRALKAPLPTVAPLVRKHAAASTPLRVNAILLNERDEPLSGKEVVFHWEKGKEVVKSTSSGVVRWPLLLDRSRKLRVELPGGARALLALVDPEGSAMPLQFGKGDPTLAPVKSAGGKVVRTIEGILNAKDTPDRLRKGAVVQIHDWAMEPGKTYTFDLESEEFDALLRLEDRAGNKLAEDNDGAGFCNSRIVFTPTMDQCRIVVTAAEPGQLGSYRLTIRQAEGGSAPSVEKKN
jgi:serine protease Do